MARKMKDSGIEWIGEIPEGVGNQIFCSAIFSSKEQKYWFTRKESFIIELRKDKAKEY